MQSFRGAFRLLRSHSVNHLQSRFAGSVSGGADSKLIRGFASLTSSSSGGVSLHRDILDSLCKRYLTTAAYVVQSAPIDYSAPAADVVPTRIKFKRLDKTAKHIMQILDKEAVSEVQVQREIPEIRPGYVIQLKMEVPENKRRVQVVKGIVIARRNAGLNTTFRLRRLVGGVGVESLFPVCCYCSLINVDKIFNGRERLVLTHQNVLSTLTKCHSDTIRLSFFIWCGKQPGYFHDRLAVDCMVDVVGRLINQFGNVRGAVKELEAVGCVKKPQCFLLLLRVFWIGGMYEFAYEVVEEMVSLGYTLNTFANNVVIDVLFKIGRNDMALKALEDLKVPNFITFNIALQHLCVVRDLWNVRSVLNQMFGEGYYPNVNAFGMVVDCFCKVGRFREAFQVLGLIVVSGMNVSVPIWSMLIDGFARTGKISEAYNLLSTMVKSDCHPNIVTYTSLIKGLLRSGNIDDTLQILSALEGSGCKPDLVLCNVLIDCFSKIGLYDDALSVFAGLSEHALQSDSYTFTSVMSAMCKSKRFALIPQLLEGCKMDADLAVCNSLLSYYVKAGCPTRAIQFYLDMIYMNYTPDDFTLIGLLNGLCKAGRVHDAVSIYQGILATRSDLAPHIHCVIIDGLFKAGKFSQATKLFSRLVEQNHRVDDVSYTVAIRGLFRAGRFDDACTLFSQMKEAGLHPNAHTYSVMLHAFCKNRDIQNVRRILYDMVEARVVLDFRTSMLLINFTVKTVSSESVSDVLYEMCCLRLLHENAMQLIASMDLPCSGVLRNGQSLSLSGCGCTENPNSESISLSLAVG